MKDPTPEQAVRAVVTTVMMHALLSKSELPSDLEASHAARQDEAILKRAEAIADKIIARAFP